MMSLNKYGLTEVQAPTRSYINILSLISLTQVFMMMIACDVERVSDPDLIRADHEPTEISGKADRDQLYVEGYWRYAAPGFYAGGTIQQQGSENYGGLIRYHINKAHQLQPSTYFYTVI